MGYFTRYTGGIDFSRDLTPKETSDITVEEGCVTLDLFEDVIDTNDYGLVEVKQAYGIIPSSEDGMRGYYFADQLQNLVNQIPADVGLSGYIRGQGEDGDVSRYRIDENRKVVHEEAIMTWPDGTDAGRN
jgi:hypothetical protein